MTTDLAATPHDTTETLGSEDTAHTAAAFADRLFESLLGGLDIVTVFVGEQLGLYDALHRRGPLTVAAAASHTGAHPRYVRELSRAADHRRHRRRRGRRRHRRGPPLLLSPRCTRRCSATATASATSRRSPGCSRAAVAQLPALMEAYRTGGGVGWEEFGAPDAHGAGRGQPTALPAGPGQGLVARGARRGRPAACRRHRGGPRVRGGLVVDRHGAVLPRRCQSTATTSTSRPFGQLRATPPSRGSLRPRLVLSTPMPRSVPSGRYL